MAARPPGLPGRAARALLLAAIRAYQRHLSPRKGFACAYRVRTGRASCSTLALRAVARYGVLRGLGVLDARLLRCRLAHEARGPCRVPRQTPRLSPSQAGFVDCGGCDAGDFCSGGDVLDAALGCVMPDDCGDCGACDRPRRKRPARARERDRPLTRAGT